MENMSRYWEKDRWITVDISDFSPRDLPEHPGCYVVFADSKLAYIGQSLNLRKRIINHKIDFARYSNNITTPWGYFKDVKIKIKTFKRYGEWAKLELRLVRRLQPPFNCVGSSLKRRSRNEN